MIHVGRLIIVGFVLLLFIFQSFFFTNLQIPLGKKSYFPSTLCYVKCIKIVNVQ